MRQVGPEGDVSLSPASAERVDKLCDQFEAAWNSKQRPSIEDLMTGVGEPERVVLLHELLSLELAYRTRLGERPTPEEYVGRFPSDRKLVNNVFGSVKPKDYQPLAATVDWKIQVTCPKGHSLQVKASLVGSTVRCPACGETVPIPREETIRADPVNLETQNKEQIAAPAALPAGTKKLGRFELREPVGSGAFGTVYRAWDPQLERDVALKVPRSGVLLEERDVQRFLREAKAAAQLRHPNIVAVYEAGRSDNTYFIASDFVAGHTLKDELKSGRRFTHEKAAKLFSQLASALHYAHTKGIIHRDMKPANVMLDADSEPHIMDFGLARRSEGDVLRTQEGAVMGTPAYMSPEQAQGKSHLADARSDLWSLGVMLYEILAGRRPFDGGEQEVLLAICAKEPESLRKLDDSIPRDLETICLKCLAKEPDRRFASCKDLADELDRWCRGEPITSRPISRTERTWRWAKRNPVLTALTSIVALLLITVAGVFAVSNYQLQLQRAVTANAEKAKGDAEHGAKLAAKEKELEAAAHAQARQEAAEADRAREQAQAARKKAEDEKVASQKIADVEKRKAGDAALKLQAESAAREQAIKVRSFADYVETIVQVSNGVRSGDVGDLVQKLDQCPDDLRSWEWRHLRRACADQRLVRWTAPIAKGLFRVEICDLVFQNAGNRLAVVELGVSTKANTGIGLRVYDASTGLEILHDSVNLVNSGSGVSRSQVMLSFSADGRKLLWKFRQKAALWDSFGGTRRTIQLKGKCIFALPTPSAQVIEFAHEPGGVGVRVIGFTHAPGGIGVRDVNSDAESVIPFAQIRNPRDFLAISPDAKATAMLDEEKRLVVFDLQTKQVRFLLDPSLATPTAAFSPDSKWLFSMYGRELSVRDAATGTKVDNLDDHRDWITVFASRQGYNLIDNRFISIDQGRAMLRELSTNRDIMEFFAEPGANFTDVAFSSDGKLLALASSDGTITMLGSE